MDWTSIGFAFSAGVIAFFSPCAFPMLPGYISYYLGFLESKDVEATKKNTISQVLKDGVIGGVSCALGAVAVLTTIAIGISIGISLLASALPVRRAMKVEPAIVLRGE